MKAWQKRIALALSTLLLIASLLWFPRPVRGFVLAIFVDLGDVETRSRYVMHIEHLGASGVPALISLCDHPDFETRLKVIDSLGVIGPDAHSAVEAIRAALDTDPDPAVRRRAAWALARIASEQSSEILTERFLQKLNKDEALAALEGLSRTPRPALLGLILKKLTDEPKDEAQRNRATESRNLIL